MALVSTDVIRRTKGHRTAVIMTPDAPIIDIHTHHPFGKAEPDPDQLARILARARRFGVGRLCILGDVIRFGYAPTADEVRRINDLTDAMVRLHPESLIGFCFLNPLQSKDNCLREMDRCVRKLGFRGIKLWVALNCRSHRLDPIMARAAQLGVPVLHHAWYSALGHEADESTPADIADLATRFPQTKIIMAHLAGCGIRGLCDIAPFPNVSVDTAGAGPVAGLTEEAVARLGAHRVVFGTDIPMRDFSSVLGRIYGARITAADRRRILTLNARALLGIR